MRIHMRDRHRPHGSQGIQATGQPAELGRQSPVADPRLAMPTAPAAPLLEMRSVGCRRDRQWTFQRVSFEIQSGQLACLLGPSGSGKTTLLRAIAGLAPVDSGEIWMQGRLVAAGGGGVPAERRDVGMLLQGDTLFPHLSVRRNVAFGLHRLSARRRAETVAGLLKLVDMQDRADAWPHELSGGQRQRVALARSLARSPRLLLLDEPFAHLDSRLRETLLDEVRELLARRGTATILVTHDHEEAFGFSDTVGVLMEGGLKQWGSVRALRQRPASRQVAQFIDAGNLLLGHTRGGDRVDTELGVLRCAQRGPANEAVTVLLRPHQLRVDADSPVRAVVTDCRQSGRETLCRLRLDSGATLRASFPGTREYVRGERVGLRADASNIAIFPGAPGK